MKIHDYIKTLGYGDDSPIEGVQLKVGTKFAFEFRGNGIVVCPYVIEYKNKLTYINLEYEQLRSKHSSSKVTDKIKHLIQNIRYPEPGRVGDVGWDVKYLVDPREFTAKERAKIAISSFRKMKELLIGTDSGMAGLKGEPGDIIVSDPLGIKFDLGHTKESEQQGTIQRSVLSKKVFNFGDVKEDGMQYAIYDQDYNLQPI